MPLTRTFPCLLRPINSVKSIRVFCTQRSNLQRQRLLHVALGEAQIRKTLGHEIKRDITAPFCPLTVSLLRKKIRTQIHHEVDEIKKQRHCALLQTNRRQCGMIVHYKYPHHLLNFLSQLCVGHLSQPQLIVVARILKVSNISWFTS